MTITAPRREPPKYSYRFALFVATGVLLVVLYEVGLCS